MRLNIYYESSILSSEIRSPITVKDLLNDLLLYLNLKDAKLLLLNSNSELLSPNSFIYPTKENEDFFLLTQMILPEKRNVEEEEDKIENLIMSFTEAKEKLIINRSPLKLSREDLFEPCIIKNDLKLERIDEGENNKNINIKEENIFGEEEEIIVTGREKNKIIEIGFNENNIREALLNNEQNRNEEEQKMNFSNIEK